MSMRSLIAAIMFCCMCGNTFAQTVTIATGGLYGGPAQAVLYCYILNNGNGDLNIGTAPQLDVSIYD